MNRLDRITAILIQLQSKRVIKAQEIADRFQISLRTVYRDIRSLEAAGIPIIGEAGVGYSIMDGYRLPPIQFTKEEATTFLMASKIVEKYTDAKNYQLYESALFKIKAVLRTVEKNYLEDIAPHILVLNNYQQESTTNNQFLQNILNAINEKKLVSLKYKNINAEKITQRDIETVGIYLQNSFWYLIAYCRLRNDYRTFRTDRILNFDILDECFQTQHPTLKEYLKIKSEQEDLQTVVLLVEKILAGHITTQKYYYGFVSEEEKGDQIEMTFLTASLRAFAGWYLTLAKRAEIVSPSSLKQDVRNMIAEIAKKV
ncbi:helix-turn-helix transcriptional regulator [Albibacterium bauzanense]|uniref:Putative DNA-binding transcriptional regulator YafY n=1 Tax=Albibacterium bauzanense TaxID=653929 RepID=A0A4R1M2J5_9SPHI|nr:YafY family protein [Albibacterium bauzanense]TCK85064.1 putative DNA-binding transcriptional regulator YafY [Albibacterium bauzanense]